METFRNFLTFGMREKELRPIEELPASRLNVCIGQLFYGIRKKKAGENGDCLECDDPKFQYEPDSLINFQNVTVFEK